MLNRKKLEDDIIRFVKRISNNDRSTDVYKDLFKSMNDKAFMIWLKDLGSEKTSLTCIIPNGEKGGGIEMSDLLKLAEELDFTLWERVWLETPSGLPVLSIHKALNANVFMRRLSQSVMSKMIVPKDDTSVDSITGQPTKKSTGNSITNPEGELLASYGLSETAKEFMNTRGGDEGAYRAYKSLIASTGKARKNDIAPFKTGAKSSQMVNTLFLTAMIHPV